MFSLNIMDKLWELLEKKVFKRIWESNISIHTKRLLYGSIMFILTLILTAILLLGLLLFILLIAWIFGSTLATGILLTIITVAVIYGVGVIMTDC